MIHSINISSKLLEVKIIRAKTYSAYTVWVAGNYNWIKCVVVWYDVSVGRWRSTGYYVSVGIC